MERMWRLLVLILCISDPGSPLSVQDVKKFPIEMPGARVERPETYLCTTVRLDTNTTHWVLGYEPGAEQRTAHHMILYGCREPGRREQLFSCGEMGIVLAGTQQSTPCESGQQVLYAWARNAPQLILPPDVGFMVGRDSGIHYLVLQVHYASVELIPRTGDRSGVTVHYTSTPQRRRAGVYVLETGGMVLPRTTTYMEAACTLATPLTLHPFAFRVHTHELGRVVSGWRVSPDMEWTLVGKADPQREQMFWGVRDPGRKVIRGGDTLAARCTMVSNRERITWVGPTAAHEMCNFYLMYWVEGGAKLGDERCYTVGPPVYSWDRILIGGLSNIPDKEASTL